MIIDRDQILDLMEKVQDLRQERNHILDKVRPLNEKYDKLETKIHKIELLISTIRSLCEHEYADAEYTDHGRVKWERCIICSHSKHS